MQIGIFYGTSTGHTEEVAEQIASLLKRKDDVVLKNVAEARKEDMEEYDFLILGTPTWGYGDLQDDWLSFIDEIDTFDFKNTPVALFGLGDQCGFSDTFVDGMGTIYERLSKKGVAILSSGCSVESYGFNVSKAAIQGEFVGLAIDEDNQPDLTEKRIQEWVEHLYQVLVA
ncbi:flavodoxin [Aminobacterium sp. MB27-C1]|jgi:flavodoxin I|uniref:flavodoxin n=1 Tax=Aminobacterium sp. MB27-C1 TaxID=3070661 RepID=UPI0027DE789D|nr:flavodoxin [Aminobacterium sp. MB27-C1]WMI70409.1 flavodoxin [Aminobacterium sp. MB27-C1]